jgi:predicted house-cleaning noncanonical NTP pyrophosphatase (MazG superfamily)
MDRGLVQGGTTLHQYIFELKLCHQTCRSGTNQMITLVSRKHEEYRGHKFKLPRCSMKNALMLSTPSKRIEVAMLYCCIHHMWGISKHKEMELTIIGQMKLLRGWTDFVQSSHTLEELTDFVQSSHTLKELTDFVQLWHTLEELTDFVQSSHNLEELTDIVQWSHTLEELTDFVQTSHTLEELTDFLQSSLTDFVQSSHTLEELTDFERFF